MDLIKEIILIMAVTWFPAGSQAGQGSPMLSLDQWRAALRSIVRSEEAFAAAAASRGTREAFLSVLGDDAILFRPQPVPGRKWFLDRGPSTDRLTWWPAFADVSSGGDLGYSTGPYELRKTATDTIPSSYGNYVTIWRRQSDGAWKVLLDFGAPNPAPGKPVPEFDPLQGKPPFAPGLAGDGSEASEALLAADGKLSDHIAAHDASSLRPFYAEGIRYLRAGQPPLTGIALVIPQLTKQLGVWTCKPMSAGCSHSGDLGYTYGSSVLKADSAGGKQKSGYYLRIWRMQAPGTWKVVLELVND